jgi:hypothetical protein
MYLLLIPQRCLHSIPSIAIAESTYPSAPVTPLALAPSFPQTNKQKKKRKERRGLIKLDHAV